MNGEKSKTYVELLNRVCDNICQNLDEDFSLQKLRQVAKLPFEISIFYTSSCEEANDGSKNY